MKLWQKVIIGLMLGVGLGYLANTEYMVGSYNLKSLIPIIKPVGDVFMNLIKMIIVPIVFLAIVSGVTSVEDKAKLGRLGRKGVMGYLSTAMFAVVTGLVFGHFFQPGVGFVMQAPEALEGAAKTATTLSISDTLLNIVPKNAIGAMAEGNILQVVFFAMLTGVVINLMGADGRGIANGCASLAKMFFKMIGLIMQLSPYGVFALIFVVVASQGVDVVKSLAKLALTVTAAMSFQYIFLGALIRVIGKISPMPFYKKSIEYQLLAFSTSSSKATLPTTMRIVEEKMGVSKESANFVLPLGASINMDGTAIYLGICAMFIAQASGIALDFHHYLIIILTSTLACIGVAGIPSGSLVMMGMIFSSVGLPLEGVGIIAGIDRILDMFRTTINITGDAAITLIIDKTENQLNEDKYFEKM